MGHHVRIPKSLIDKALTAIHIKRRAFRSEVRRAISAVVHAKQFAETEQRLSRALSAFLQEQISDVQKRLESIDAKQSLSFWKKTPEDQASVLIRLVYNPRDWERALVDAALPPLARGMEEAIRAQFIQIGGDPNKTTASEWLEYMGEELPPGIITEMPQWMLDAIEVQLRETFKQDYWIQILETSGGDIEGYLRNGLHEGLSIREMARQIHTAFPAGYSTKRAIRIARTESGNALNSARALATDQLKEDLGEVGMYVKKEWVSVLSERTRPEHAALHGVLEDKDGLFNLAGTRVPWPAHHSLEASQRINCMCTLVTSFGPAE